MRISRRNFMKGIGLGLSGLGLGASKPVLSSPSFPSPSQKSEKLLVKDPAHPKPAPLNYDRLPLAWYKNTVKRL
ncbi:MAG: twin-arginine translocation signal domain-containing protein, partial [Candidatus Aminicenantes bacterium]|nr:twin-arginine translocation signal domain-containing protein [Candidatus Aminicenantes bacterium]